MERANTGGLQSYFRRGFRVLTDGSAREAAKSNCDRYQRRSTGGAAHAGRRKRVLGKNFDRTKWVLGVSLLNLFPLPREAGFRQSFAYAGEAVDLGYSVLVFPEGHYTVDGEINPFRAGIGLLATNLGIPVLPMRIVGLFEVKHAGRKFVRPGKISVRVGKPEKFDAATNAGADCAAVAAEGGRVAGGS
jgi:hypothetical protein